MNSTQRTHELIGRFFGLAGADIEPVIEAFDQKVLQGSEWLFQQGDAGTALYFLVRGRLQVWIDSGNQGGTRKFVGEVQPGETVGEISLLTGQPRSASIRAARDSLLLRLDRANFERLAETHPKMAVQLAGNIAERLQHRTSGKATAARQLVNICLLPLDDVPVLQDLANRLVAKLGEFDSVLDLDPARLAEKGAPIRGLDAESEIPETLPAWLDEQEYDFRFVVYRGHNNQSPWTQLALRQADLVIRLADSSTDTSLRAVEALLQDHERHDRLNKQALVLWHRRSASEISATGDWLNARDLDFHLHVREDRETDLARLARIVSGHAVGLVLGAGAARGFAHIGVYRALTEAGIDVDWVGGASIGAILGAGIAKGWSPETLREHAHSGFVIGKPFSNYTLPVLSLLSGKRMVRLLREILPGNIEDLPIPFFCNSSSLDSGSVNVHTRGPISEALRASAAMPGALPPAIVNRHLSVDGAVLNGLPVDIMRQVPVGEIIGVDLSSHKTYELDYEEIPTAWQLLRSRFLPFGQRYRLPGLIPLLLKSTEIGSMIRVQQQGRDADLLLSPDVRKFGLTNVKPFDRIVEAGYEVACEKLPAWLQQRSKDQAPESTECNQPK